MKRKGKAKGREAVSLAPYMPESEMKRIRAKLNEWPWNVRLPKDAPAMLAVSVDDPLPRPQQQPSKRKGRTR